MDKRKIVYNPEDGKIFISYEEGSWTYIFDHAEKDNFEDSIFIWRDLYRIDNISNISIFKNIDIKEYYKINEYHDNLKYITNDPGNETKNIFHWEENDCISMFYAEREDDIWIIKDKILLAGWKTGCSFYDCKIFDNEFMIFDSWFRKNFNKFYSIYWLKKIKTPAVESKFYKYIMDLKNTYELFQ